MTRDAEDALGADFARDVREGLGARPKHLPPRWLYDPLGSVLFEAITLLPEYYLTRTEQGILDRCAGEIAERADGGGTALVELGAGSGKKTRTLIRAMLAHQDRLTYCPIDISATALEAAAGLLALEFPGLEVKPVVARYRAGLARLRADPRRKLVLFIGSSIGNFDPPDAARFLADVASVMGPRDRLLLGTDLDKDPAVIEAAYNDAAGVTEAFIKNLLARINRELGGDFDLRRFQHRAVWNPAEHRMEMHLDSLAAQRVRVAGLGLEVDFAEGEALHTENSYKFTPAMVEAMVAKAGLVAEASWSDERRWFALHLLAPGP